MFSLFSRGLIRIYQYCISPFTPVACRFQPSCSEYMAEAIRLHGLLRGGVMGCKRIGRCHPWGGSGYDPVPAENQPPITHLRPHDPQEPSSHA